MPRHICSFRSSLPSPLWLVHFEKHFSVIFVMSSRCAVALISLRICDGGDGGSVTSNALGEESFQATHLLQRGGLLLGGHGDASDSPTKNLGHALTLPSLEVKVEPQT